MITLDVKALVFFDDVKQRTTIAVLEDNVKLLRRDSRGGSGSSRDKGDGTICLGCGRFYLPLLLRLHVRGKGHDDVGMVESTIDVDLHQGSRVLLPVDGHHLWQEDKAFDGDREPAPHPLVEMKRSSQQLVERLRLDTYLPCTRLRMHPFRARPQ